MSGARIVAEQESATRLTLQIEGERWDGVAEVGRLEIDVARHLLALEKRPRLRNH